MAGNKFFSKYYFKGYSSSIATRDKFNCKIYNKVCLPFELVFFSDDMLTRHQALLSVFKSRVVDPTRERDTAVEKCDVSVEDGEGKAKSRFIIKIMCRHGKFCCM